MTALDDLEKLIKEQWDASTGKQRKMWLQAGDLLKRARQEAERTKPVQTPAEVE